MLSTIDPMFVLSNRVEAALWGGIALAMAVVAVRRRATWGDGIVAAVAFALFGLSDIVETTTGAWWRPWWLLAWKAACVATLLVLLVRHARRRRCPRAA
jgi:hypothetical protein